MHKSLNWKLGLLSTLLGSVGGVPVLAHHSGAMFDRSQTITLKGTVKEFKFTNPHSWVRINVTDKSGKTELWDIEASAPARLSKWGISPKTLHSGDKITLTAHPIRDGRKAGSLVVLTLADGRVLNTDVDVNAYAK
jgi:hypothetical protein